MKKQKLLYEGKAKKVWSTESPGEVVIEFKDSLTAFNAQKKGQFAGKGALNLAITGFIFEHLQAHGIKTHFKSILNENEMLSSTLDIIPLEVVVRNRIAGSYAKRFGLSEGEPLKKPLVEFYYKNDELQDPFMSDAQIFAMQIVDSSDLDWLKGQALRINHILLELFQSIHLSLVDFKVEFGRNPAGEIVLADEITPDSCRLWDLKTEEKMDKDRFRRDLGGVEEAYQQVAQRILEFKKRNSQVRHFVVEIRPREVLLDTQGRAVLESLKSQPHYANLTDCRVGRLVEMTLTGDSKECFSRVKAAADSLLHNPLIEQYQIREIQP